MWWTHWAPPACQTLGHAWLKSLWFLAWWSIFWTFVDNPVLRFTSNCYVNYRPHLNWLTSVMLCWIPALSFLQSWFKPRRGTWSTDALILFKVCQIFKFLSQKREILLSVHCIVMSTVVKLPYIGKIKVLEFIGYSSVFHTGILSYINRQAITSCLLFHGSIFLTQIKPPLFLCGLPQPTWVSLAIYKWNGSLWSIKAIAGDSFIL